jgi:hypothetical protein
MWARYKDCAGATCQAPMTELLTVDAASVARLTARYWGHIGSVYGR